MRKTPIIKFNGGEPIALCNRCFVIMCYVTCTEEGEDCKVLRANSGVLFDNTSAKKGDAVPIYCDQCDKLLKYALNE
jgi:invasion protein IalB